jgi:tellurite methyltransferase
MSDWKSYHEATKDRAPRALFKEGLALVSSREAALDVGVGSGSSAKALVAEGFKRIDAIDASPTAGTYLPEGVAFTATTFDTFEFSPDTYDFINAEFALPFNPPDTFEPMFNRLKDSLKEGGIFTGQFFGTEDSWSTNPNMTFHTKEEAERLLSPLEIFKFEEVREKGTTALQGEKFWHVYHIIAKKK